MALAKRKLGNTGEEVTILGLGGEGVLRTMRYEREAYLVINKALDLGVNYFESARAYAGSESYYGLALKERRNDVFLTSKSHARDKEGAAAHLRTTLKNMKTDHVDLWQVHDMRTQEDIDIVFGKGGAMEAFLEAKEQGLTRFLGVTGHHDPEILSKCLDMYDFDTVLIPVNPAEPGYKSFMHSVLPKATAKGMGVIGMKVYLRGLINELPWVTSPEPFLRYALSQDVSTVVIGCDKTDHVVDNFEYADHFHTMTRTEMDELEKYFKPIAR